MRVHEKNIQRARFKTKRCWWEKVERDADHTPRCIKWCISVTSLQNKSSAALESMAFVPCSLSCAGISFHGPALLIKAARLSSQLHWRVCLPYLMFLPCSIHFCCTDQKASEEFIKRNYSKKERGEEDQDMRHVALNKLDAYPISVERTSEGEGAAASGKLGKNRSRILKKRHDSVNLISFVTICWIREDTAVISQGRNV